MNKLLLKCVCGKCSVCRNRQYNRTWRDKKRGLSPAKAIGRPIQTPNLDRIEYWAGKFLSESSETYNLYEIALDCRYPMLRLIALARAAHLKVVVSPRGHRAYACRDGQTTIAREEAAIWRSVNKIPFLLNKTLDTITNRR
jgi:hypothetical protein